MLRIENIHFSYGKDEVLKSVTLSLNASMNCLLGPNGSGKSTLLKIITGILPPRCGTIRTEKVDILNLSPRERSKMISYVPQEFSINFPYKVSDVVLMGRNPYINLLEGPKTDDEKIVLHYLRLLNIENLKDKPFTHLSGGQKRMVLIARGLAQEGKIMLFDEPTMSLDFKNQLLVLTVIEKISKKFNKCVLLSLHDPNLALLFCDELFLLKGGKIIREGIPNKTITEESMMELYNLKTLLVSTSNERSFVVPKKDFLNTLFLGEKDDFRKNRKKDTSAPERRS